jgi:type II secretory pathway component PulF
LKTPAIAVLLHSKDGNTRTFGILLVNRLLLKEGLEPAIMEDPNRFNGYAVSELVDEIKKGQNLFRTSR